MTKNPPTRKAATAAAVAAAIAGTVETLMLSPDLLVASPTNPRKTFPQQSLDELASTLKADGQIQAITVRPLPANRLQDTFEAHGGGKPLPTHELVVGERRWRAAQLAGLDLRCEVRELTDLQVVRIQIIENLHREEVHPLEEAEGYEYLVQHSADKITVEQVANEVGKSTAYVYQRMKLCQLCTEARKAFYAGDFDASTALLIARIPTPDLQLRAIEEIKDSSGEDGLSYRRIRSILRQRFTLRLETAPFDITDATLVVGVGTCAACPKRTGNQPMLFDDVGDADVCLDPDCFGDKRKASVGRAIDAARADGCEVIEGDAARGILPHYYPDADHQYVRGDYTDLNDAAYEDDEGSPITFADLLEKVGKKGPKPMLVVHPDHPDSMPTKLISNEAAKALLKKFGPKQGKVPTGSSTRTKEDPEREAIRRKWAVEREYRGLLQEAIRAAAGKPRTHADLVLVAFALNGDSQDDHLLEAAGGKVPLDDDGEPREYSNEEFDALLLTAMQACPGAKLGGLVMRLASGEFDSYGHTDMPIPVLEYAAESHGVKLATLQKKAEKAVDGEDDE